MTGVDLAADMAARLAPSARQLELAKVLIVGGAAQHVIVPISLPGKRRGLWTAEQVVWHPEGLFPVPVDDPGPGHMQARNGADATAGAALDGAVGVAAYAVIYDDATFTVFEGISGRRD